MKNSNETLSGANNGAESASPRGDEGFDSLRETSERSPVEQLYHMAAEIEQDFAKRLAYFESKGEEIGYREFKQYENALSWRIDTARLNDHSTTPVEQAELMSPLLNVGLRNSVEGYAGHFYVERTDELDQAMEANSKFSDEEKRRDRKVLNDFTEKAARHRELVEMQGDVDAYRAEYGTSVAGAHAYNDSRKVAHDEVINQINQMNDIARKYGVMPFLPYNLDRIHYPEGCDSGYLVQLVHRNRKIAEFFYQGVADSLNRRKYGPDYKGILANKDKEERKLFRGKYSS